jgi:hypothetical protein
VNDVLKRLLAFMSSLAMLATLPAPAAGQPHPKLAGELAQLVLERFLVVSAERRPVSYRAVRRLEASSARLKAAGWVEALTEFEPTTGLRVRVLAEGGSGRIRGVLKGVLEAEREAALPGRSRTTALTADNYAFQAREVDAGGLVAVRITPRRRESALVDGTIFVSLPDAEMVRLEGRLAKSPSFWTRSVDLVRRYERRAGRLVPVEVRSFADVKVVGVTEFVMTYAYASVDGQPAHEEASTFLLALMANQP